MKNVFLEMQENFESKFDAQPAIEAAINLGLTSANVFGQFVELYIPMAAGAAVKMTTGSDTRSAHNHFGQTMPDFDWRYRTPDTAFQTPSHPKDRFSPFIPF